MQSRRLLDRILARLLSPRLGYLPSRWPETVYIHLRERALATDTTESEYLDTLLRTEDPDNLAWLIDAATIGHTAAYRHPEQFEQLRAALAALAKARPGPVQIWCAGCSTGEEAYSLAHTAQEIGVHVAILATDVNPIAVEVARSGRLPERISVGSHLPDEWAGGVPEALRRLIRFEVASLTAPRPALGAGPFDIVFCRNVLIYFEREQVPNLLTRLAAELVPDGHLVISPAEGVLPLPDGLTRGPVPGWLQRSRAQALHGDGGGAPRAAHDDAVLPPPVVLRRWRLPAGAAPRILDKEGPGSASRHRSSMPPEPLPPITRVEEAARLLGAGHAAEAEEMLSELLNLDPDQLVAWFLLGEALLARGERAQARTAFLRAARSSASAMPDVDVEALRRTALRRAGALSDPPRP